MSKGLELFLGVVVAALLIAITAMLLLCFYIIFEPWLGAQVALLTVGCIFIVSVIGGILVATNT